MKHLPVERTTFQKGNESGRRDSSSVWRPADAPPCWGGKLQPRFIDEVTLANVGPQRTLFRQRP